MHLLVIAAAYIKLLCYASNLFSSAEMHTKIIKRDCYQIFILIPSKSFWIGKVVTLISLSLCHKVTRDLLLQSRCCLNTNHNLNIDHLINNLCPFSIVTPRNAVQNMISFKNKMRFKLWNIFWGRGNHCVECRYAI